jgi:hypothetical protein
MAYSTMPIVGAFYRPPAAKLIEALPIGTPLFLLAEPDNQHDPNAIAVWLESHNIPESSHGQLDEVLPNFGSSLEIILAQDQWHLGYIPKELAKLLRQQDIVGDNTPVDVTFAVAPDGKPRVRFTAPVL